MNITNLYHLEFSNITCPCFSFYSFYNNKMSNLKITILRAQQFSSIKRYRHGECARLASPFSFISLHFVLLISMQFQGISFRLGVVVVPEPQVDVFRNVCAVVWAFAFVSECDCLSPDCRGADVCGSVSRPTCSELKENESATPGRAVPGRAFASMRYISSRRRKVFAEDIRGCGVLLPF